MSTVFRDPESIGQYRVIDRIGAGGMGTVYRVCHRATGRVAAAKVLHANTASPVARDRFRNEARIHMALRHPGIATVYEYLEVDNAPCLVMEFVDGETLEERVQRGPLTLDMALKYFMLLVDAVGYVHQRGVIHRDLKTNNVKLDANGNLKLLDFGIAMGADTPRFTSTGNVVGTLLALSPEQLRTGRAGLRSDIWALGAVFYEMLIARSPFQRMAPGILAECILSAKFVPVSQLRQDVPREVDRIIGRCLRVRPEDRYASCEALLTDVAALAAGRGAPHNDLWKVPAVLLNQSGEVAQRMVRQWQLTASALAAIAALIFFVWAVWPSSGNGGIEAGGPELAKLEASITPESMLEQSLELQEAKTEPRTPRQLPPPDRSAGSRSAPSTTPTDLNHRHVLLRVVQGEADVYRDGVLVGHTPYRLEAPAGEVVNLTLRRAGCDAIPLRVKVEEGVSEFIETFRRCGEP
ncbi:MAG TPA: serine/threonine-protein kinase [Gemmatimonadales bacterium]|nr:serine/threonine-protein kinase [Gemmatimonadales bacterium]